MQFFTILLGGGFIGGVLQFMALYDMICHIYTHALIYLCVQREREIFEHFALKDACQSDRKVKTLENAIYFFGDILFSDMMENYFQKFKEKTNTLNIFLTQNGLYNILLSKSKRNCQNLWMFGNFGNS